jgi:membrane complex biogenesis BtpA family protein
MVHVGALPGTPYNTDPLPTIVRQAADEARLLEKGGLDALIIENMHDRPYLLREVGPEIVASMTAVGLAVRDAVTVPFGVQVLAGANAAALAVAQACGASSVRVEGFVFAHVADEGLMHRADAARLLRYRSSIGAKQIAVLADVKKKHSAHALTADVDLAETAQAAEFFGADAVVVTGAATGRPTSPEDVRAVRQAVNIPVMVGSGVTAENLSDYWPHADAFIVGSYLKRGGVWSNAIDPKRLKTLGDTVATLRL